MLVRILDSALNRVPHGAWQPGDVAAFRNDRGEAVHTGIVAEQGGRLTVISAAPRRAVVEVGLSDDLIGRIVGAWSFRGID
jgi:hypothetical protein